MTLCCFNVSYHTIELLQYYYSVIYIYLKLLQYFSVLFLHSGKSLPNCRWEQTMTERAHAWKRLDLLKSLWLSLLQSCCSPWLDGRTNVGWDTAQMLAAVSWLKPHRWTLHLGKHRCCQLSHRQRAALTYRKTLLGSRWWWRGGWAALPAPEHKVRKQKCCYPSIPGTDTS